jgi:RsiW-degrading membrane proteinase PrsW (M82 family)
MFDCLYYYGRLKRGKEVRKYERFWYWMLLAMLGWEGWETKRREKENEWWWKNLVLRVCHKVVVFI